MSLRLKTILGVALIEAILLVILISMTLSYLESTNYDGLYKRATTTATLFSTTTKDAVISYDLASLDDFTNELIKNPDIVYVKVLTPEGDIFAQSGDQALLDRPFSEDLDVSSVTDGVFDIRTEIKEGDLIFGIIELGIDTSILNQSIEEARYWSATIAFGEMLLVALFSFLLGTYLTNRLKQLRETANQISLGNTDITLSITGKDEVAEVAHAFNQMTSRLTEAVERRDAYEKELKQLNQTLESRVERRTLQLKENIKKLESTNNQLQETHEKLVKSEKMASIGVLAAGVAHEINNPVGYVMSNMRTLKEYSQTYIDTVEKTKQLFDQKTEDLQEPLKEMNLWLQEQDINFIQTDTPQLITDTIDGTERIRDIVAGLKEFSHSTPNQPMQLANLNEAIERTLKVTHNELKYTAKIETKLGEIPKIKCNIGQVQQVLLNLMINAGHALKENGRILITSGVIDKEVFISVQDNGTGIPKEIQKKIFDPFFTTKDVGTGSGLGLSISYGIMQDHKGRIDLKSVLGKGSKFTLYFPSDVEG